MRMYSFTILATAFLSSCLPDPLGIISENESETTRGESFENNYEDDDLAHDSSSTGSIDSSDPESSDEDSPELPADMPINATASFTIKGKTTPLKPNEEGPTFGWSDLNFRCTESAAMETSTGHIRVYVTAHTTNDPSDRLIATENNFPLPCSGEIRFLHSNLKEGLTYKFKIEVLDPGKKSLIQTFAGEVAVPDPAQENDLTYEMAEQKT